MNGETFTMSSADAAFPTLVAKLLPAGFKGLVVCGILAALMSSLASLFNSSAMLFTIDFYKKYRPKASEKTLLYVGRVATVVVVVLGILWIPVMKSVGSVLYNFCRMYNLYWHRVLQRLSYWVFARKKQLRKAVCGA